jgi:hypothetical protein
MASPQLFHNVAVVGATGPGLGNAVVEAFLSNPLYKTEVRFLYRADSLKVRNIVSIPISPPARLLTLRLAPCW